MPANWYPTEYVNVTLRQLIVVFVDEKMPDEVGAFAVLVST